MLKKVTLSGSIDADPANRSGPELGPNPGPAGARQKKSALRRELRHFRNNRELFLLSLPGILYKLIFAYIPLVGLIIAFKHYRYDLGIF
ncbi:sugar ABC transporter permease, partial [Clostridium perfringens]